MKAAKGLIVKLGSIGDVAAAVPAVWQLSQSAQIQIDWLCGRVVAPLLNCFSWIRPIVVDDASLLRGNRLAAMSEFSRVWRGIIGSTYDLCAVLHYDHRYRLLVLPVRARRKIAMDWDDRRFQLVSERHHSAEYARILCNLQDGYQSTNVAPLRPDKLPDNPYPRDGKIRIALAPGGARNLLRDDPQRRWPIESYVALARLLLEKGYEVVLSGAPSDNWVVPMFDTLPIDNFIGAWEIPQTLAFYDSCDCVVTHDSGPLHLAGLMNCGLIGLFGPTAPYKALPRRNRSLALWGGEMLPCRPCYDGRECAACEWNGCMTAISPAQVAASVDRIIANPSHEWRIESF